MNHSHLSVANLPPTYKTVAVIHFHTRGTDGVSLEINENNRELKKLGWNVIECSADIYESPATFPIPELEYATKSIIELKKGTLSDAEAERLIKFQVKNIIFKLEVLLNKHNPNVIYLRNILSLPIHPAATIAFAKFIKSHPNLKFLAQHHDFLFSEGEKNRYEQYKLKYKFIQELISESILIKASNLMHATINSLDRKALEKIGINAVIIPDSFDFNTKPLYINNIRETLGIAANDLVIGMPTRIAPRKAIEIAIQFTKELQDRKNEIINRKCSINGIDITDKSHFIVLLPHINGLDEPINKSYYERLKIYAKENNVVLFFIGDKIVSDSIYDISNIEKLPFYSIYKIFDLVIYPSYQEGFGNQFLEASVLRRGIIITHKYPVMTSDILPIISEEGIISLGDNSDYFEKDKSGLKYLRKEVLQKAVRKSIYYLLNPRLEKEIGERNYIKLKSRFDSAIISHRISELLLRMLCDEIECYSAPVDYHQYIGKTINSSLS